jgi:hypothetical protein
VVEAGNVDGGRPGSFAQPSRVGVAVEDPEWHFAGMEVCDLSGYARYCCIVFLAEGVAAIGTSVAHRLRASSMKSLDRHRSRTDRMTPVTILLEVVRNCSFQCPQDPSCLRQQRSASDCTSCKSVVPYTNYDGAVGRDLLAGRLASPLTNFSPSAYLL